MADPERAAELALLREDYLGYERAAERFVGIYLSALAAGTAFLLGPDRLSLKDAVSGNAGWNVYLLLLMSLINLVFICYILFKGLQIHEVMQFAISRATHSDMLTAWEEWRRHPTVSLTRRIRKVHYPLTSGFPVVIGLVFLATLGWGILWTPASLVSPAARAFVHAAWPAWAVVVLAHVSLISLYVRQGSAVADRLWTAILTLQRKAVHPTIETIAAQLRLAPARRVRHARRHRPLR